MHSIKKLWEALNRKNIILIIGAVLCILIVCVALFAPYLTPHNPTQMALPDKLLAPDSLHPFGTDNMGRDILSRVLIGSRISLTVAFAAIAASSIIGTAIGLVSGFAGGAVDMFFMRIVDILLAFPTSVFVLAVSTILGSGQTNLVVAICLVQWTRYGAHQNLIEKNSVYAHLVRTQQTGGNVI